MTEELTTEEILSFLNNAISLGVTGISFSGGEPLIRTDLFDIISYCKKLGLFVHINSNGTLVELYYKEINKLVDSILISIDSENSILHDRLRGVGGTFEKALKALELLNKSKVIVQMVVNSENINSLYEYVKYMNKKVDRIRLQPLHHNPENLLTLTDEKLGHFNDLKSKWTDFVEKLKLSGLTLDGSEEYYNLIPEFLENPKKIQHKTDCFMGSHAFFLDPYGNVVPCEGIREPFGNIRKENLNNIWKKANNFRRIYNKRKKRPCVCLYSCLEGDILFWKSFFSFKRHKNRFP